jgi:broad specificity phosphatase PhoE
VQLVDELREIDFGRWEGLTREEIEASDPILAKDWLAGAEGFEYPGGEPRARFEERVARGLAHILSQPVRGALVVAHKGVIRTIVRSLTGAAPEREAPALGGRLVVTWQPEGRWILGTRGSNPPGLPVPGDLAV